MEYVPTDDEMKMNNSDQALPKTIPHLYQSFLVREYADHDDLVEGIFGLFEEIDVVIEDEILLTGILDSKLGEPLQSWTSTQILIPRSFR